MLTTESLRGLAHDKTTYIDMSIENAAGIRAAEKAEIVAKAHRLLDTDFSAFMLVVRLSDDSYFLSGGSADLIVKLAAEALIDASETANRCKHHFEQ